MRKLMKWTGGIAGLCLLCCAAPLASIFLAGGTIAGTAIFTEFKSEAATVLMLAGIVLMLGAAYAIWRRQKNGAACDVPSLNPKSDNAPRS